MPLLRIRSSTLSGEPSAPHRGPVSSAPRSCPGDLPRALCPASTHNRKFAPLCPAAGVRQCATVRPHHPVGEPRRQGRHCPRLYNTSEASACGDDVVPASSVYYDITAYVKIMLLIIKDVETA